VCRFLQILHERPLNASTVEAQLHIIAVSAMDETAGKLTSGEPLSVEQLLEYLPAEA
jgi:hypothetical protein